MFRPLIAACDRATHHLRPPFSMPEIAQVMAALHPHVCAIQVTADELPWGRYLLHNDPAGRYNVQLDLFSPGYTGAIHAHGTWGMFWVLKGALNVWNFALEEGGPALLSCGVVPAGGANAFCPPISDWHQVGTPASGPQTASIHIYGEGFDLDTGVYLDPAGRITQAHRSPFKDLAGVEGALRHTRQVG